MDGTADTSEEARPAMPSLQVVGDLAMTEPRTDEARAETAWGGWLQEALSERAQSGQPVSASMHEHEAYLAGYESGRAAAQAEGTRGIDDISRAFESLDRGAALVEAENEALRAALADLALEARHLTEVCDEREIPLLEPWIQVAEAALANDSARGEKA